MSIYGNIDAALIFYRTYLKWLIKMGLVCSKLNPCLFMLFDENKNLRMIASCHVNNTQMAGPPGILTWFKTELKKRFSIKELGTLTKHLGIKHDWKIEADEVYFEATMDDLV